ncbi:Serine/threonine-protein kinase-like protein ACR4, partial [Bienertia sinuspersici]
NNDSSKDKPKVTPDLEELKIRIARVFSYKEGSFSSVFKGVLKDGTVVAGNRTIMTSDQKKDSNELYTELDLLRRILVYEFMAHGSLHHHLHGKDKSLKVQLDWVRRIIIVVQASRGIDYLPGYACRPVIH